MSEEKTLESVFPSEDVKKETEVQSEAPLQEDEELVDDTDSDSATIEEAPHEKRFKTREERAAFFKQKHANDKKDDVLTKSDLYKINERKAIREMTTVTDVDAPDLKTVKAEINDNWNSIVLHFNPNTDRTDVEAVKEGIIDAYTLWKRRNSGASKDDVDTAARAALMADAGAVGSTGKGTAAPKKTVLGKQSKGMDDWFPAKGN